MSVIERTEQETVEEMDAWARDLLAKAARGDVPAIKELFNILDGEAEDANYVNT